MMLVELTAAILAAACSAVAYVFHKMVPDPYMDEIFHIPQAQNYCAMNFSHWDPMITTPPGLYFLSFMWIYLLNHAVTFDLCTVTFLRGQNIVCMVLLFLVLHSLLKDIRGERASYTLLLALNLTLFPVLFFFTFLYYTDVGATLFTLVGYLCARRDHHFLSAMCLLASVCFRQTSVVWVVFVAGAVVLRTAESAPELKRYANKKHNGTRYYTALLRYLLSHTPHFLRLLWPYALTVSLFLAFVYRNGSIVLGDKTHHTVSFHLPQLMYFSLFSLSLSPSLVLDLGVVWRFLGGVTRKPKWTAVLVLAVWLVMGLGVHFFTYEHQYLLADNRHYPFYVWKNIFRRNISTRFLLVPVYAVATLYQLYALSLSQHPLWLLCFSVCCFVALVPQKLLEFRYFILPFLLLRIHTYNDSSRSNSLVLFGMTIEFLLYVFLNAVTVWLFLYRPFKWPDSSDWQHFMW